MKKAQRDIKRKLRVLDYAQENRNISKTCCYFGISWLTYYEWKKAYAEYGEKWLINSKPCPENPTFRILKEIEKKILCLSKIYNLGNCESPGSSNGIITQRSRGVYQVLKRNGLNRLPRNAKKRSKQTQPYKKQLPGHHIQIDLKSLKFPNPHARAIRRFQYTFVDDATRIRAQKIYTTILRRIP